MPTISFNGKTYNNVEEMPVNERKAFEQMNQMFVDKNGNGIPDLLEGDLVKNVMTAHSTQAHVTVNGKTYTSFNDLPPEVRQQVDGAFQMLSNMGILSGMPEAQQQQQAAPAVSTFESKPFNPPGSSAIEEESGRSTFSLILIGIVLCFAVVVGTIAVLYLLNR